MFINNQVDGIDLIPETKEKPRPKKLFFDKPFVIVLKRNDSKMPYFISWIKNAELMEIE